MARKIVINEFLTFIQNKIDVLDELSIVQICATNFTEAEIETGKTTLFDCLPDGNRCVTRKGDEKNKKNIKDVIKLFHATAPELQPIFVAQDLNRLPPVSFDHVDVTRLLKDLVLLKNELHSLRNDTISKSEMTLFETKVYTDINNLKSYTTMPEMQTDTPNRQYSKPRPRLQQREDCKTKLNESTKNNVNSGRLSQSSPIASAEIRAEPVHTPTYRDIALRPAQTQAKPTRRTAVNKHDDSFILVERKKRSKPKNSNMIGTAQMSTKIQVADMTSAIYVSRLKKSSTVEHLKEHISDMGEQCVNVELLQQKQETNFNSFKVTVPRSKLNTYLSAEFWPEGVMYRRFREASWTAKTAK
ncbi:uncharacterized protein LOC125488624 [Plutella xylostella]|uniref:uncharacterized protein LOC125488624 n=1 Tax=Plutella xylostella TaxID=51655 RepID=UPI00203304FB|nr:uncharacterized protein LOC125488624 [Plutella xylostella]